MNLFVSCVGWVTQLPITAQEAGKTKAGFSALIGGDSQSEGGQECCWVSLSLSSLRTGSDTRI